MNAERTIIYGGKAETCRVAELLHNCAGSSFSDIRTVDSWASLQQELELLRPGLLVVLTDGAAGMEGVYLARQVMPELPVFWFSDDSQFGMQSHRLECTYFSTKPVTDDKLRKALNHYTRLGIRL